jgi:riboflavin-specific deaminase-like protein
VTLKYAQTLDGRIATSTGHSRWITGPEARILAHRLRAEHDGILVGVGTVLADDPAMTVRLVQGSDPLRIVVDSTLRTPPSAAVFGPQPQLLLLATTSAAPDARVREFERRGAQVIILPAAGGRVDLNVLMVELESKGMRSLLVEGGAGIITSLFRLRLADDVAIFIAPKLIGAGLEAVGDLQIRTMDQVISFADRSVQLAGQDVVFRGRIVWGES